MKPQKVNWRTLNNSIQLMTEQEIVDLLNEELTNRARASILERLHQRFCALRSQRERIEILAAAKAP